VLFLKYLDDLEKDKATAAELTGKPRSMRWATCTKTKSRTWVMQVATEEIMNMILHGVEANASVRLRKLILENCNLHTVLDFPGGTFTGLQRKRLQSDWKKLT
jgi:hypothetical protein